MRYFDRYRTEKGATKRYRELAKRHHPDVGGDADVMADINGQYAEGLRRIATVRAQGRADKGQAQSDTNNDAEGTQKQTVGADFSGIEPETVVVEEITGAWRSSADDHTNGGSRGHRVSAEEDLREATVTVVRAGARLLGEVAVDLFTRKLNEYKRRG